MTSTAPRRTRADRSPGSIQELQEQLDGNLSFGRPPTHTQVGAAGGNGELAHLRGAFVRQRFTALNTPVVFQHNLGVPLHPLATEGRTNVLWHTLYVEHDGTGAAVLSPVGLVFTRGDAMTANAVSLRCFAVNRTVNASHPVHVVLFFVPGE